MKLNNAETRELEKLVEKWFEEKGHLADGFEIKVHLQFCKKKSTIKIDTQHKNLAEDSKLEQLLQTNLAEVGFSSRIFNLLNFCDNSKTIGDFISFVKKNGALRVLERRNFGIKSFLEIRSTFQNLGVPLGKEWVLPKWQNCNWKPTA